MERSSMRYAAVACVVAGGLLMGGTGAVALAGPERPSNSGGDGQGAPEKPGGDGQDGPGKPGGDGQDGPGKPDKPTPKPVPGHGGNHGSVFKAPKLNIPSTLGQLTAPVGNVLSPSGPITLPTLGIPPVANSSPQLSIATLPAGITGALDGTQLDAVASTLQQVDVAPTATPPAISLGPLPPGVAAGPPLIIDNPLPDALPIDPQLPIVPQVVPPPIVPILAASQQIPLVDFLTSPLLDVVVAPNLLSDIIVPTLLSDLVVPTVSLTGLLPGIIVPTIAALSDLAAVSLTPSVVPPADLAPTGMDMPQAQLKSPAPAPSAPVVDSPQQPQLPARSRTDGAAQLSEPVAFRAGYSDYLRNAGMAQITSIALPGIAGILLVTFGGGFIGYRQARAGHIIRADGIARFLR